MFGIEAVPEERWLHLLVRAPSDLGRGSVAPHDIRHEHDPRPLTTMTLPPPLSVANDCKLLHCRDTCILPRDIIQGSAKRLWPGYVNAAGKLRQKEQNSSNLAVAFKLSD